MSRSTSMGRRLTSAAGAAAASLAGAQSLEAAISYHAVDVEIPADTSDYAVDLNGDSVKEFDIQVDAMRIKATEYGVGAGTLRSVDGLPANLPQGTVIGPGSGTYSSTGLDTLTGIESGNPAGNFQVSDGPGFLGVEFAIGGNTHYGFVGYEGTGAENSANGRVFALAYETTPGTGIVAGVPEPESLALLAAGAAGVAAYRRRRQDG